MHRRVGMGVMILPQTTVLRASSTACWDTRRWEGKINKLVKKTELGLGARFNAEVTCCN